MGNERRENAVGKLIHVSGKVGGCWSKSMNPACKSVIDYTSSCSNFR